MPKLTPSRQQYLDIKAQHPDAIVMFRLGDFYETFDGDAELVSRELDLTLTGRGTTPDNRVPMAGVPYHAAETYIAKLVEKGYHVVIAEQMGEAINGLMPREVTRVITPGTVIEPGMLDQKRNNYLLALCPETDRKGQTWGRVGLAYTDITTGEFAVTQLESGKPDQGGEEATVAVLEELARLLPREVLLPRAWTERGVTLPQSIHLTAGADYWFDSTTARQTLCDHFGVQTLDGFGLDSSKTLAIGAAGALIQYVRDTQRSALAQLTELRLYHTGAYMILDPNARRTLEITETLRGGVTQGSLLGVLDHTITAMGSRRLRAWLAQPLLDIGHINARLDIVEALYDVGFTRAEVRDALQPIADLERLTNRVVANVAGPRELLALAASLEAIPTLRAPLIETPLFETLLRQLDPCADVTAAIRNAICDETPAVLGVPGVIKAGHSAELDQIEADTRGAKDWVANLESIERDRTGIKSLKVSYNKVFGYYIEVSTTNASRVPSDYERKQTLVNGERYITPDLKRYEHQILTAEARVIELETALFKEQCKRIAADAGRLMAAAHAVAELDVYAALAEVAARENYVRPALTLEDTLTIRQGRHPVVEKLLRGERYVPNNAHFDDQERIHVITGPNMAGKSTAIRQVALITLMAQMGSFVPAEAAEIGIIDRIFTRIGAQDEIHAGQSTFMVEMTETASILQAATPRSLLILDEIGRGTSTYDGLAIARAVIEYVHNHPRLNCKTLFATHYHELTELEKILPRVRNYNVAVAEDGDGIVFLHQVIPGGADRSYGVHVAQLAGMPRPLVSRAREILKDLEENGNDFEIKRRKGQRALPGLIPVHPALEALRTSKIDELSPMEAIMKLYELQRLAREEG
ncbi:MAG: DNA mismatch repair protein MutS [Aggregatilineales bacterium]